MASPYLVAKIHDKVFFDGRIAAGQSDNNVDPLGLYTDKFDTTRWLARGRLTGTFRRGNWQISPHAGVIYFEEEQETYTDSLGILIPRQTISLGRLSFGPKLTYGRQTESGTVIASHLGLEGLWDFDEANIVDLDTGLPTSTSDDLRGRVEGGIAFRLPGGLSMQGIGFYDGIGVDDLDAYGGTLSVSVPFN